jgi:imidazoleglycerol-phosphate dehydratase
MEKKSKIERKTKETQISLELELNCEADSTIETGIAFFDHMLSHVAKHGNVKLNIKAKGDIEVDFHHTVEDIGIVLGQAIIQSLGDKKGINRYGWSSIPMDETLANVSLDISGRPVFVFNVQFTGLKVGEFDTELVKEFFRALSNSAGLNLHINVPYGDNNHHIAEAIFKAFGWALRIASAPSGLKGIPSTKGVL